MHRLEALLADVAELCRWLWHELDAHGFALCGNVAITSLEQIPARVRRDYMLAPIYASSVSLEPSR